MGAGSTDNRLPKESVSQRTGQEAVQAFFANHPANWRPTPLDGDSDFGLDQMIQVVDANENVSGGVFFVQIKGSDSLDFSQNGESISIQLKIKTLNYYCRIADPVMLVAVDRSSAEYPKDCRAYWTWISEEIRSALDGASDFSEFDQESLTIKIPANNELTPEFDILPALSEFRRRKDAMEGLLHAIDLNKGNNRSTLDAVHEVTIKIESTLGPALTTFSESFDSPWENPPRDSIQGKLHQVHALLINNNDEDARNLLNNLRGTIPTALALENAEYHYQNGRTFALESNAQRALVEFEKAHTLMPNSDKYTAAVFETRFQELYPEDDESDEIRQLLDEFPVSGGDRLMALKARLHGAIGDYETAEQILSAIEPIEAAVSRALNAYLQKKWTETIAICETSLASDVPRLGTKATLTMVLSRAYFYSAMADCEMPESEIIPPFGLPGTDLGKFEKAWAVALDAIALFRQQNWPPNVEHIVDIIGSVAPALNKQSEALIDLRALSKTRPKLRVVHDHLARLAALADEYQIEWEALDALEALDGPKATVHLRVHALYAQKRYRESLSLAEKHLLDADSKHILHASCLGISALCAYKCMAPERADQFVEALESNDEWAGEVAVFKFVLTANSSPLERDRAKTALIEAFNSDPESSPIQDNLFDALDAEDFREARICIKLASRIQARRLLAYREVLHLSQAYVTHADWLGLANLADRAINQYGEIPRTIAIKAVALDGAGDAGGALRVLEELIETHPEEDLAINSYVNICIRTGFHQKAADQIESLFLKATKKNPKLTYLRQLFSLKLSVNRNDPALVEIAWRFGKISDQEIEREEGLFLNLFVAATRSENIKVSADKVEEFQRRANAFFDRWPESRIIRRFDLPGNATAEELGRAIEKAIGTTEKEKAWYQKLENQLEAGEMVVPYCWRPRRLLRNISNVPHLWHVTQNANKDERKYQFNIYSSEDSHVDLSRGLTFPPLLDLTTLLVLFDIDVLKHLFSVFPKIAISVETALDIQQLAHPFLGGYRSVVGIRDFLKANVDRILQPSDRGWQTESGHDPINIPLDEIKCLAATKSYSVYLDDVISRTYVLDQNEEVQSVTTLDVLIELERREILSTSDVAQILATLVSWNVGVAVTERYFLSAIPAEVQSTNDLDSLVEILTEDQTFKNLVDGIWDIRQDYQGVLNHFTAILADIARGQSAEPEFVAAIWAVWELKVELRQIGISREKHRALVMIHTAMHTENHEAANKRLWDAYILLVYKQYGSRMDEQQDKNARELIGVAAAQVVAKNDGKVSGDDLLKTLLCAFESGVAEYDWVSRAYVQERARLEAVPEDPE